MGSSTSTQMRKRLLFLGLDNAGKTTIMKALSKESATEVAPTRGFNVKQLKIGSMDWAIWDIGGQKPLRAFWTGYYDNVSGIVWVIDSADGRRLPETGQELGALLEEEKLAGVPLLILANKQDLGTATQPDEIATELGLNQIRTRAWSIAGCSALTGQGLGEIGKWLTQTIK